MIQGRWLGRVLALAIAPPLLLLVACRPGEPRPTAWPNAASPASAIATGGTASSSLGAVASPLRATATLAGAWGQPFSLSAGQVRAVATITAFLDAYNAGRIDDLLALLAEGSILSDCDYRAGMAINLQGKAEVAAWLRERIADRDQLIVAAMQNENPDQRVTGAHIVGVTFARRTSDTLRALGNPDGIAPRLSAKVSLTADDAKITRFANGPYGGPPGECQRDAGTPAPGRPGTPPR